MNYGSIDGSNGFKDLDHLEHDMEESLKDVGIDDGNDGVPNRLTKKQGIASSSLSILFLVAVAFLSMLFYHLSRCTTGIAGIYKPSMALAPTSATTSKAKGVNSKHHAKEETFEVPFPHVDRSDYSVPASSIVDPLLFSQSLRGSDQNSSIGSNSSSRLLKVPFPTGAFWTNLVIKPTADQLLSYPVMAYPYGYKWNPSMIQVSYPALRHLMDHLSIRDIFNPDLSLCTKEEVSNRHVQYFDQMSVTLRFEQSLQETVEEKGLWETYLVQGSPYVTARYENMTPVIHPLSIFKGISCIETEDRDSGNLCMNLDSGKV